jgi:hypothetical protein
MIPKAQVSAAVLAGLLACSTVGAQIHGGVQPVRVPAVHTMPAARVGTSSAGRGSVGSQSTQQGSVIRISPSGWVSPVFPRVTNSFSLDEISGVPGLGFDFPHLAAISKGSGNDSSHFGRHGHHGQGFFTPIFFGGYPYYYDDPSADQTEQQPAQQAAPQPQIIVIQQPAPERQEAGSADDAGSPAAPTPESQAAPPIRDVGDFILVRRDGRVLFASVFSVVGDQLQYVTPEGIRRTLVMSDLDLDATQQMNEARGTTIQFHN